MGECTNDTLHHNERDEVVKEETTSEFLFSQNFILFHKHLSFPAFPAYSMFLFW